MNEKTPPEEPKEELEEPILLEKSYLEGPKSPPWILIGFLLFVLFSGLWKRFVAPHFAPEKPAVVEQENQQIKRPVFPLSSQK